MIMCVYMYMLKVHIVEKSESIDIPPATYSPEVTTVNSLLLIHSEFLSPF